MNFKDLDLSKLTAVEAHALAGLAPESGIVEFVFLKRERGQLQYLVGFKDEDMNPDDEDRCYAVTTFFVHFTEQGFLGGDYAGCPFADNLTEEEMHQQIQEAIARK